MLEKALESPLDSKEIQPVHPKGDQSWIFTGRTEAEVETPILCLATWCEELTHWKRPWCWERLKVGGEGDDRGWDGWMASLTWWTWVWVGLGAGDGQGSLACCSPWGCKELDTTERLNWTELSTSYFKCFKPSILLIANHSNSMRYVFLSACSQWGIKIQKGQHPVRRSVNAIRLQKLMSDRGQEVSV